MIIKQLYFHTYFPNEFEYLIKKAGDSPGIKNVRERQQPGNILIEIVWKKTFFHFTWNFVHFVSNRTLKRWLAVLQNSFVQEIVYSVSQKFLFLDFAARKKNFIQVCSDLLEVTGYKNEPYHGHWIEMNQKFNLDFWLISILCHGRHETALLFPPASGWPMVCYNISNSTTLPNYHMVTFPHACTNMFALQLQWTFKQRFLETSLAFSDTSILQINLTGCMRRLAALPCVVFRPREAALALPPWLYIVRAVGAREPGRESAAALGARDSEPERSDASLSHRSSSSRTSFSIWSLFRSSSDLECAP